MQQYLKTTLQIYNKTNIRTCFHFCLNFNILIHLRPLGGILETHPIPLTIVAPWLVQNYPKSSQMAHHTLVLPPHYAVLQSKDASSITSQCIFFLD